ncbi:latrophilin-3 [Biomphalaria glabrata]|nr:latrophilin-3 [Biomphalaria glabrata]
MNRMTPSLLFVLCVHQLIHSLICADLQKETFYQRNDTGKDFIRNHNKVLRSLVPHFPLHTLDEETKPMSLGIINVNNVSSQNVIFNRNDERVEKLKERKMSSLREMLPSRVPRSAPDPGDSIPLYNIADQSQCTNPLDLVQSIETYRSTTFDQNCVYDFHCYQCFTDLKRYNCQCDLMCWFYGDCCFDFYFQCLDLRIDADDSEIFKAILKKLDTETQVHRLFESYLMLKHSSCVSASNPEHRSYLVNKCGRSLEIRKRYTDLYDRLKNETDSFVYGMSMEDVEQRCEDPYLKLNTFDNIPKSYTKRVPKFGDQHVHCVHFSNRFCTLCNGFHPTEAIDWDSYVTCPNNITLTLYDAESFSEFFQLIRKMNCTIVYSASRNAIDRFCYMPETETKHSDFKVFCDDLKKSSANAEDEDLCLSYKLCSRYSFRFADNEVQKNFSNPHCYRAQHRNISYSTGHLSENNASCRYSLNPCDYHIKFSFDNKFESLRQLFYFKPQITKKQINNHTSCHIGDTYVPQLNTCSDVACPLGSLPILGKCLKEFNTTGMASDVIRVKSNFKPMRLSSALRHRSVTNIRLIMAFTNLLKEPEVKDMFCQSYFHSTSAEEILANETLLLLFWNSCIIDSEKRRIENLVFKYYEQYLGLKKEDLVQFKISFIAQCNLIDEHIYNCTIKSTKINQQTNSNTHFSKRNACQIDNRHFNEEDLLVSCLVFELESNEYESLFTRLTETYYNMKKDFEYENVQLIKITVKNIEANFVESNSTTIEKDENSYTCDLGYTLQSTPLRIHAHHFIGEVIYVGQDEIPEDGLQFLVNWSMNKANDTLKPDTAILSLCFEHNASSICPSNEFIKFDYQDAIFDLDHIIISFNTTKAYDYLDNLDILITTEEDIQEDVRKQFGSNLIHIIPKSQHILLDTGFLVCTRFLSNNYKKETLSIYTFIPSTTLEKYATFASSILSIVCLVIVILTYAILPVLRAKVPGKIVLSLSLSLLFSHLLFLFSLQLGGLACRIYAALHHASWLACFTWQAAMSLHLSYTLHNRSLDETCPSTYLMLSLLCWGLPLLLATACFLLDFYSIANIGYGQNGICWIGSFSSSVIIFTLPATVCIVFSIACSIRVVYAIRKSVTFRRIHASSYSSLKREIFVCINLSMMMGFDWLFFVLTLPTDNPYLWIPFLVCHGSQGLFIFLCFVAKQYTFNLLVAKFCHR